MNYRDFTIALEHRLGTQHLLVDRQAKEPAQLLLPTGVHDRLLREVLRAIYRANKCYHIKAPLDRARTLAAIAPVQARLRAETRSDIDVVRLGDELFTAADELLEPPDGPPQPAPRARRRSARVVALRGARLARV